jgi:hypothetical protein
MRSGGNAEAIKLIIQYPDSNKGTAAVETEIAQCDRVILRHHNKPELSCRVAVAVSARAKEYLQDTPTKFLHILSAEMRGD